MARRQRELLRDRLVEIGQFSRAQVDALASQSKTVGAERLEALRQILEIPLEAFFDDDWRRTHSRQTASVDPEPAEDHSSVMNDAPNRAEVAAEIAAAEARIDTKFAELRGDLRLMSQSMIELRSGQRATQTLIVGSAIAAVAVIVATLGLGATWFGLGINAGDVAYRAADQAIREFVAKTPLNHQ